MKKIMSQISQKDRIICLTVPNAHEFYYVPARSTERHFLFRTDSFSGSVFSFFRDKGRNIHDRGFSMTVKELYEHKKFYRNPKIAKLLDRIPRQIDAVLRTDAQAPKADKKCQRIKLVSFDKFEIAA